MSDDFHRPTYTTEDVHGAFNATQVRLYGIPGLTDDNDERKNQVNMYSVVGEELTAIVKSDCGPISEDKLAPLNGLFKGYLTNSKYSYVFINAIMKRYLIMLGALKTAPSAEEKECGEPDPLTAGIIFGYAYEGHTYDLPKPKIMLIPAVPQDIPCDDSGYNRKRSSGYRVWLVDKLDQCVEIDINQGFVEQLVLEANLPGKRSPNMYVGRMMMSHRSGRLTE
jgi:hypothetical protein